MFFNLPNYIDITTQYIDSSYTTDFIYNQPYFTIIDYNFFSTTMLSLETNFFINQLNTNSVLNEVDNIKTIYHYSIPNTKLYYPEPYLAAASFMHTDLWFVHILIYQYWLWFVFVFMIIFFFITFICVLRWCNVRVRPRRETRGVSRSKCGDLITACVPVSWAASIIVNESADAIDYYDGFGTSELVVGIRAYQWGWEYYYPKDIDLNYHLKTNTSVFLGNSLKYDTMSDLSLKTNKLWKYYQIKSGDASITPAHLLLLPTDNYKLLNFNKFSDIGLSNLNEANAFKKIKMFSKTFQSNLSTFSLTNTSHYNSLQHNLHNDSTYLQSYFYGLKRQHNFLSSTAVLNNLNTFFDLNSLNKYVQFNMNLPDFATNTTTFTGIYNLYYDNTLFNNKFNTNSSINMTRIFMLLFKNNYMNSFTRFSTYLIYPSYTFFKENKLTNKITNQIDLNKLKLQNFNKINWNSTPLNDFKITHVDNLFAKSNFYLNNWTYLTNKISTNITYDAKERTLRNLLTNKPTTAYLNFTSPTANKQETLYNSYLTSLHGYTDLNFASRAASNRIFFETPYAPITSTHPLISSLNYDSTKNTNVEGFPILLQSKEDLTAAFVFSTYWNFLMSNSINDWNYSFNFNISKLNQLFYSPLTTLYYDYDFRNLQALELIEDMFWETVYPIINYDDYLTINDHFSNYLFFNKYDTFFNNTTRNLQVKDSVLFKPFAKNLTYKEESYPLSFYFDENILPTTLINTSNYFVPVFSYNLVNALDESYENFKFVSTVFLNKYMNVFFFNLLHTYPHSTSTLFDTFRSDYDEFSWFTDSWYASNAKFSATTQQLLLLTTHLNLIKNDFKSVTDLLSSYLLLDNKQMYSQRTTNFINHISTVKNAIVTQNAMQKVFKSRFDEGRAHTKLLDFANFENKHQFITTPSPSYEGLLSKNKESFFNINLYKMKFLNYDINYNSINSSLNFYCYDFPFLLAYKSDASRYLWFDWYAKWSFVEVQPSSQSRYALYGMPYFTKVFEFNTAMSENYNESENYFSRLSRARQNYLPAWTYTPYFYARANMWYADDLLVNLLTNLNNPLLRIQYLLVIMNWYWSSLLFTNLNNYLFFSGHSMLTSYGKAGWQPIESVQSYYYNVTYLIDTLVKREYLYRQLLESINKTVNLPLNFTATPKHPLISELKALYLFSDPISYNNEYSRDIYYQSLMFFNANLVKPLINNLLETLNLQFVWNYFFLYFFNTQLVDSFGTTNKQSLELQKNQYRPLRKGISNMIRIHATGAIAMPTEIRVQILVSSKDVIHSWAIPSAGIKLDCVPGYSSHKMIIFLLSGIFWGQCMEICGRYHHWMPIVIYFMKRDLFFLWCLHFVFLILQINH